MHLSYLQYQLHFCGIHSSRMRNAGNCRFSSWRLYEPGTVPEPDTLYFMTAQEFQEFQGPAAAVCIPDYPAGRELPEQNGLYMESGRTGAAFYNLIQKIFSDYEKWDFALSFAERMDPSQLLELSTPILHIPLTVIDNEFHFVARNTLYAQKFSGDSLNVSEMEELLWSEEFRACTCRKNVFHFFLQSEQKMLLCYNLFRNGRFFARILGSIEEDSYAVPQEILFSRMVLALKSLIEHEQASYRSHGKSREFLAAVRCLLEGERDVDPQILLQQSWSLDDTYSLSVVRCSDRFPVEEAEQYLRSSLQLLFPDACVLHHGRDFVCVWNMTRSAEKEYSFREKMSVFLRDHAAKAGDSNPFCGQEDFSLYLSQACEALRLGEKYAPHFWHYRFEDYACSYLLERCSSPYGPWQVASPALKILRKYDDEKAGDLYRTLDLYLQSGCNVSLSAELLHIHRTSMIKRLNRIKKLTGIRLEEADTRLYLMLSYKILKQAGSIT